ncbi:MAG: hypothetical protein ABI178_06515 [Rhodanobacter sp.]
MKFATFVEASATSTGRGSVSATRCTRFDQPAARTAAVRQSSSPNKPEQRMSMSRWQLTVCTLLLAASAAMVHAASVVNTTGLPDYPGARTIVMDNVYRGDALGRTCIHYASETPDELGRVEAWYRDHMAGARETPVNSDNMYGHWFAMKGIKLERGHDFANVYRTARQKSTSVELFKCKG